MQPVAADLPGPLRVIVLPHETHDMLASLPTRFQPWPFARAWPYAYHAWPEHTFAGTSPSRKNTGWPSAPY